MIHELLLAVCTGDHLALGGRCRRATVRGPLDVVLLMYGQVGAVIVGEAMEQIVHDEEMQLNTVNKKSVSTKNLCVRRGEGEGEGERQ